MQNLDALLYVVLVVCAVAVMAWALRARKRSHAAWVANTAQTEVCDHLRPAYELLLSRGHRVLRVGQKHPDLPLEIHFAPRFEPQSLYEELKLNEPVFVSERNVLYCKDDWCELHPKNG